MSPNLLRAIAAVFAALAVIFNGTFDAKTVGELIFAVLAVITLVQAQINSHVNNDEAH